MKTSNSPPEVFGSVRVRSLPRRNENLSINVKALDKLSLSEAYLEGMKTISSPSWPYGPSMSEAYLEGMKTSNSPPEVFGSVRVRSLPRRNENLSINVKALDKLSLSEAYLEGMKTISSPSWPYGPSMSEAYLEGMKTEINLFV